MRATLAKFLTHLQWGLILTILFFSTLAFGGAEARSIYFVRLLLVASLIFQTLLFVLEDNYLNDFHPSLILPGLLFFAFLSLVCIQYVQGTKVLSGSVIGSISPFSTYTSGLQLGSYWIFFMICLKHTSKRVLVERLSVAITLFVFGVTLLGLAQRLATSHPILWKSFSSVPAGFFGPFVNENHFGGFVGLAFPLVLGLMHYRILQMSEREGVIQERQTFLKKCAAYLNTGVGFLFLLLVLTLCASFFSLARVSAVVILFACLAYVFLYWKPYRNPKLLMMFLFFFFVSFLLLQWLGQEVISRGFGMTTLKESLSARLRVTKEAAISITRLFPLFGSGLGTFRFISPKAISYLSESVSWNHADNDYVELLVEMGVVGSCLFLGTLLSLVGLSVSALQKVRSRWSRLMAVQALISIFSIGVMEFFDFHLKIPSIALLFSFQLALLFGCSHPREALQDVSEEKRKLALSVRRKSLVFPLLLVLVASSLFFFSTKEYLSSRFSKAQGDRVFHLKKALAFEPANAVLWYELAKTYDLAAQQKGERETIQLQKQVIDALRKAVALGPTYAYYWYYLGASEYAIGYEKEGIASLEKSVFWAPARRKYSLYLLALYLREMEKAPTRLEQLEFETKARNLYHYMQRLEIIPNEGDYQRWMGEYYYSKLKRFIPDWSRPE